MSNHIISWSLQYTSGNVKALLGPPCHMLLKLVRASLRCMCDFSCPQKCESRCRDAEAWERTCALMVNFAAMGHALAPDTLQEFVTCVVASQGMLSLQANGP